MSDLDQARRFKKARIGTGLSHDSFAELFGIGSGRTVRRWEAGEREIPGTVWVLLQLIYAIPEVEDYFELTIDDNWQDIDVD